MPGNAVLLAEFLKTPIGVHASPLQSLGVQKCSLLNQASISMVVSIKMCCFNNYNNYVCFIV